MAKVTLTEQDKEQISAMIDGEADNLALFSSKELESAVERYSLIGDVIRSEEKQFADLNIAENVALALDAEPVHQIDTEIVANDNVVHVNWKKPFSQFAIAASVAAVAIFGIQMMPTEQVIITPEAAVPNVETMPFGGFATPVSYSSEPTVGSAQKGLRELQEQRIGALVLEHQRQARLVNSQELNKDKEKQEINK